MDCSSNPPLMTAGVGDIIALNVLNPDGTVPAELATATNLTIILAPPGATAGTPYAATLVGTNQFQVVTGPSGPMLNVAGLWSICATWQTSSRSLARSTVGTLEVQQSLGRIFTQAMTAGLTSTGQVTTT